MEVMYGPEHIEPNATVDSDHPAVVAFAEPHRREDPVEAAVSLYYAVRDGFRYNPWNVYLDPEAYKASAVIARGPVEGAHCIDKALVMAAGARALGIPSRLHFANVRNHVGTAQLEKALGTDLLVFHGYVGLWLEGRWVAATPAFNASLCERLGVEALDFDGRHDSVFQAYDRQAGRFMEYVEDHGAHATIPFDAMFAAWKKHYGPAIRDGWPSPGQREG
ncbi:MAG: transglutaminase domain-containing protein [Alphaproteobacteria bacterium]|nr:transglutaminase domain-containing protein [Alphaproteobacteria bacterium]